MVGALARIVLSLSLACSRFAYMMASHKSDVLARFVRRRYHHHRQRQHHNNTEANHVRSTPCHCGSSRRRESKSGSSSGSEGARQMNEARRLTGAASPEAGTSVSDRHCIRAVALCVCVYLCVPYSLLQSTVPSPAHLSTLQSRSTSNRDPLPIESTIRSSRDCRFDRIYSCLSLTSDRDADDDDDDREPNKHRRTNRTTNQQHPTTINATATSTNKMSSS